MMRATELHPRNRARMFQLSKSKHQMNLMMKPLSQNQNLSQSQSPQREGHVAVAALEAVDEAVVVEAVVVERQIRRGAHRPEISFSLQ